METTAYNFHDDSGIFDTVKLEAGDDAGLYYFKPNCKFRDRSVVKAYKFLERLKHIHACFLIFMHNLSVVKFQAFNLTTDLSCSYIFSFHIFSFNYR